MATERYIDKKSGIMVLDKGHPRAHKGYVAEHILLAEKALGKPLPTKSVVHHVDRNIFKNYGNLVVCENQGYHRFIHARMTSYEATGDPDLKKCYSCSKWFPRYELSSSGECRKCAVKKSAAWYGSNKEKKAAYDKIYRQSNKSKLNAQKVDWKKRINTHGTGI